MSQYPTYNYKFTLNEYALNGLKVTYTNQMVTFPFQFNITCPENEWRLSIVGSIGYFSDIIMLPLHGFMSDR